MYVTSRLDNLCMFSFACSFTNVRARIPFKLFLAPSPASSPPVLSSKASVSEIPPLQQRLLFSSLSCRSRLVELLPSYLHTAMAELLSPSASSTASWPTLSMTQPYSLVYYPPFCPHTRRSLPSVESASFAHFVASPAELLRLLSALTLRRIAILLSSTPKMEAKRLLSRS